MHATIQHGEQSSRPLSYDTTAMIEIGLLSKLFSANCLSAGELRCKVEVRLERRIDWLPFSGVRVTANYLGTDFYQLLCLVGACLLWRCARCGLPYRTALPEALPFEKSNVSYRVAPLVEGGWVFRDRVA